MHQRCFPVAFDAQNERFSLAMIQDVAAAMGQHGYPGFGAYTARDVTELHMALFRFLYQHEGSG